MARAGEHGKGFDCCRNQKAGAESKRSEAIIKTLIGAMEQSETSMHNLIVGISQVEEKTVGMARHTAAIAEVSKEQDEGLQQIAQGINTLEEGLSQNAAMAEEIHATSVSLATQNEARRIATLILEGKKKEAQKALTDESHYNAVSLELTQTLSKVLSQPMVGQRETPSLKKPSSEKQPLVTPASGHFWEEF